MTVTVIRCSGIVEHHVVDSVSQIGPLIGAGPKGCDVVNLRDGRAMFVDGSGYETETVERTSESGVAYIQLVPTRANKPDNPRATELYHATCLPGTTHRIVGDVAIVTDAEVVD